jgi:hypothetical protein
VVFYPLYPALIRILSLAFGAIGSALIISTISSFIVFWGFLETLKSQLPDASRGRGFAVFVVWPASFILFAGYTEALTIALVLWCMLFARSERWVAAAVLGFAAGLTRSAGSLLIFPLSILAWKSRRRSRWWIVLAPIGTLTYWAWLRVTGRPGVVSSYRTWDTAVVAPWTTLWRAVTFLAHRPDTLVLINLAVLTLFAVAGSFAWRRAEDRTFSALIILQILMRSLAPPLSGAFRYVLPIYPAFLTMAEWAEGMKRTHFVFLCAVLFAFNLVWMWEFLNWSLVL